MTKDEIVTNIAVRTGMDAKAADGVIAAFLRELREGLVTDKRIQLPGFGTFEVKTRSARTGCNPHTGEQIEIPERATVAFRAGKALRDAVNN